MPVDINERRFSGFFVYDVRIPDLFVERFWRHVSSSQILTLPKHMSNGPRPAEGSGSSWPCHSWRCSVSQHMKKRTKVPVLVRGPRSKLLPSNAYRRGVRFVAFFLHGFFGFRAKGLLIRIFWRFAM